MTPTEQKIHDLHAEFCRITNQDGLTLRFNRQREWYIWMQYGFTADDLRLVVRYLKKGIATGRRNPGALKHSNLVAQPDRFEEDLMEARRILNPRTPRPSTIVTQQKFPDGSVRAVETEAPSDMVDVRTIFRDIRKNLSQNRK